jgi:hypothetical protein
MTDYEKWQMLLTEMGIGFETAHQWAVSHDMLQYYKPSELSLNMTVGGAKITGYSGFQCGIDFNCDGSFHSVDIGE